MLLKRIRGVGRLQSWAVMCLLTASCCLVGVVFLLLRFVPADFDTADPSRAEAAGNFMILLGLPWVIFELATAVLLALAWLLRARAWQGTLIALHGLSRLAAAGMGIELWAACSSISTYRYYAIMLVLVCFTLVLLCPVELLVHCRAIPTIDSDENATE